MMLFDAEGKIQRYESPEAILAEFATLRLLYYHKRKLSLLAVSPQPPAHRPPHACSRFMSCLESSSLLTSRSPRSAAAPARLGKFTYLFRT